MNKKITGTVKNGKFQADDKQEFSMAFCSFEGKPVEIVVRRKQKSKNRQYRYLYGVVYQLIADHLGYTIDEVDYLMKIKFSFDVRLGVRVPRKSGKKGQSKEEFTNYITNIRNWAHDFFNGNLYIPEPNAVDLGAE
tara:strand:+ start:665 stop:1072 length:408 start_codon:yes stop_codon:yes gene_type:complete